MNEAYLYLEHVSDDDLRQLILAAGVRPENTERVLSLVRNEPQAMDQLFSHPAVYEWLFNNQKDRPYLRISPMVAFSVLVHRTAAELENISYVQEWTAPRQRLPVFAVAEMRRFLADRRRRFYLADLLSSFTKVMSGSILVKTARGRRRQRYNELDPVALARLAMLVKGEERMAVYRRLGDLALFLTGVFPDHTGRYPLRPIDIERLARVAKMSSLELMTLGEAALAEDPYGAISVYERLGQRWYHLAAAAVGDDGLRMMAEHFREGRRILNFLADRHLHKIRCDWFPEPAAGNL